MTEDQIKELLASNGIELPAGVKSISLEIEIKRAATGKVEKLGVVSARHKNKIINAWLQLGIKIRGYIRLWQQS